MASSDSDSLDFLICCTCGVQYSTSNRNEISSCKICDDPRQYIPPTGQKWTTLRTLQSSQKYHNEFITDESNPNMISIHTVPQIAIGQRAILCLDTTTTTSTGNSSSGGGGKKKRNNILWDCITYIDTETIHRINTEYGGIAAIVISHPHFYATNLEWAQAFDCPVYLAKEDEKFLMRRDKKGERQRQCLWTGMELSLPQTIVSDSSSQNSSELKATTTTPSTATTARTDFLAIKAGGHFPGSSVLWWKSARKLLVADTIMVVPSGIYHPNNRVKGTTSFSFMWSYPNMIPLPPDEVHGIWKAVRKADFDDVHSGFLTRDVRGDSKRRVLESAQIIVKAMGYMDHAIHREVYN